MSDHKQNSPSANDGEFDRDLAVTSNAYRNVGGDTPPAAIDDAIRAAARRAVKSQPHAARKSWISRWSTPLSAAALVVLSVSVGFLAIDERPELAPAPLQEAAIAKPSALPATPARPLNAPENAVPAAAMAPRSSQPVPASEKKSQFRRQNEPARDQLAESVKPNLERRRDEAGGAALATLSPKDERDAVAVNAPSTAGSIAPVAAPTATLKSVAKESPAFAPDPPAAGAAARQGNVVAPTETATLAPTIASRSAISSPLHAAAPTLQSQAKKADEPPEVWMKRILELKQQGKTREFDEQLAQFRKRYPEFKLPEELRERWEGK